VNRGSNPCRGAKKPSLEPEVVHWGGAVFY
jgi:hypothetical protein